MKKNVITYGTFDTFHYGHMELLNRAKKLGNHLTVAVSTDEFNTVKGKTCMFSYDKRVEWVKSLKSVDRVISENNWDQKCLDLVNYDIDVFVMGNDWNGKFDFLSKLCKVVYLNRTDDISSTDIKKMQKQSFLKKIFDAIKERIGNVN